MKKIIIIANLCLKKVLNCNKGSITMNPLQSVFFLMAMTIAGSIVAQVNYSSFLRKSQLKNNSILFVQDGDQGDSSATKYFKRSTFVKLKYMGDRNTESPYYNTWTYQVVYKLANATDTNEFIIDTLKIAYGPLPLDCKFLASNEIKNNWKSAGLRVLNICATSGGSSNCLQTPSTYPFLPEDIELELVLQSIQISTMTNQNGAITKFSRGSASEIGISEQANVSVECDPFQEYISWAIVPSAVEYELEWVYIPNDLYYPSQGNYFNAYANSQVLYPLAFELAEPVRITTKNNYYPFPEEYPESGMIYYRARPVGRIINPALQDYDQPEFYPWTYTVNAVQTITDFPEDKNWQRVTTFAEDGKFKKVISYYDGLYRSRQSLTHMSSDNNTIVAETLYDHEGRGVVQMLPYPEKCTDLTYKPGRRKDINGNDWNKYDFELTANAANNDNKKLQTTVGASQYYSATNPYINPMSVYEPDLYTPDAELFPFTQVEYMMDGTGRVSRTSGVGPNHLLGSGHETRYFYVDPSELELRRLFGSNVGDEKHYKKNIVVDANGQASTSYMDQEGRVIATALLGDSPQSLIELDGVTSEHIVEDLSDKNLIAGDNSVLIHKFFNAVPPTNYTFTYEIPHQYFLLPDGSTCQACVYDFNVTVEGPNGTTMYTHSEVITPPASSPPCNSTSPGFTWSHTFNLVDIGDYTFYKSISWNADEAAANLRENIEANSLNVLEDFQNDFLSLIDSNDCDPFLQNEGNTYGNLDSIYEILSDQECQGMLHEMMNQLSPGGFYFEDIDLGTTGYQLRSMQYDANGNLSGSNDFVYYLQSEYGTTLSNSFDPFGTTYELILRLNDNSDLFASGFSGLSHDDIVQAIVDNWRFEWGEILARFLHPEYCHFQECMYYSKPNPTTVDETTSSLVYDLHMTQLDAISPRYTATNNKYLDPQNNGNINPFGTDPFNPTQTFTYGSTPEDPWPFYPYPSEVANLQSHINQYRPTDNDPDLYSIWEFSCPTLNISGNPVTLGVNGKQGNNDLYGGPPNYIYGVNSQNEIWNIYRGSYLQAKTDFRADPGRLQGIGCPILNIPEKVYGGIPDELPSTVDEVTTSANNIIDNLDGTPNHLTDLLTPGSSGDLCYESCENKADLILDNILDGCLSLFEIYQWMNFNEGTINAAVIQNALDDYRLAMINHCMADCESPLAFGIITVSELDGIENPAHPMHDVYLALDNLQDALVNAGLDIACSGLSDMQNGDWIETAGDENNTMTTVAIITNHCEEVDCFEGPNYVENYLADFINNMLGSTSPFSIGVPAAPLDPQCTYCGCLPPTTIDNADPNNINSYPSGSCISLSKDCENYTTINCSSQYTIGGITPGNTIISSSTENGVTTHFYKYPLNQVECTDCNFKFFCRGPNGGNDPTYLGGDINIPVSVISGVSNIQVLNYNAAERTFSGTLDLTFISPYAASNYLVGTDQILRFELDLKQCAPIEVCHEETLQTVESTFEINYAQWQEDCMDQLIEAAKLNGQSAYQNWLDEQVANAMEDFRAACIKPGVEKITKEYDLKQHHYTLYYYDQADNLVQTIPPLGVHPLPLTDFPLVNNVPTWNGNEPIHELQTVYQYNSLNQPVEQLTPDGGLSLFYYDDKGRITHSQNAKQRAVATAAPSGLNETTVIAPYSRTIYDELGRIVQVSERTITFTGHTVPLFNTIPMAENSPYVAANGNNTELENEVACSCYMDAQITRTYYEVGNVIPSMQFAAENTRSRVAFTTFQEFDGAAYDVASHYSYDIHGNVKTLVNEYNHLIHFGNNRYKRTDYKYDLVSGKVNQVQYQPGRTDKFIHKYSYDADNRLTRVETSPDYTFFETDAKYFYYAHGPLSRMEVGERKVQGVDYAYTIHGWLKGVNAGFLNEEYEMGKDGYVASSGINPNKFIAWDAFGYVLDYYQGDYTAAGSTAANYKEFRASMPSGGTGILDAAYNSTNGLFNGNIIRMHTALSSHDYTNTTPQTEQNLKWDVNGSVFHYDQLNRIRKSIVYEVANMGSTRDYGTNGPSDKYGTEYTYDANGNIKTLKRFGNIPVSGSSLLMDNLTYQYGNGNNQLTQVNDSENSTGPASPDPFFGYDYNNDLENQTSANNYEYDEIGNLIADANESVSEIKWSVYGKVREVIFSTDKPNLEFVYDASGQRVMKIVKTKVDASTLKPKEDWKYTVYSRDAQGNILSIYEIQKNGDGIIQMNQAEVPIYGSSRLGVYNANKKIITATCAPVAQYSTTNTNPIITCQAENQGIPPNPQLIGTVGNPNAQYVYFNANANTFNIQEYQVGTSGTTTSENANITLVNLNGNSAYKIKYVPVIGNKQYEFTDHLGNVLVTLNDVKKGVDGDNNGTVDHYEAHIQSTTDYYPFGMPMPGRYTTAQKCSTSTTTATLTPINHNFSVPGQPISLGLSALNLSPPDESYQYFKLSNSTDAKIQNDRIEFSKLNNSNVVGVGLKFHVEYGKQYSLSFDMFKNCTSTNAKVQFKIINATTSAVMYTSGQLNVTGSSQNFTFNNIFTADITGDYIIQIYRVGANSACTFYLDNLKFTYIDQVNTTVCVTGDSYFFGFNGKEKTNEWNGEGNIYDYGFRIYDPRIGKFLSVDPLFRGYPQFSSYQFTANNPILNIDLDGLENEDNQSDACEDGYSEAKLKRAEYDNFDDDAWDDYSPSSDGSPNDVVFIQNCFVTLWNGGVDLVYNVSHPAKAVNNTITTTANAYQYITSTPGAQVYDDLSNAFSDCMKDPQCVGQIQEVLVISGVSMEMGSVAKIPIPKNFKVPKVEIDWNNGIKKQGTTGEEYGLTKGGYGSQGYKNSNVEIKENNEGFDYHKGDLDNPAAKNGFVQVKTTQSKVFAINTYIKAAANLYKVTAQYTDATRILQIYVKRGVYSNDYLSKMKASLQAGVKQYDVKVEVEFVD